MWNPISGHNCVLMSVIEEEDQDGWRNREGGEEEPAGSAENLEGRIKRKFWRIQK